MSALSKVLSDIEIFGTIYFCDQLSPPWRIQKDAEHSAAFHYVRRGQCWLTWEGKRQLINGGDLIFLGSGAAHQLEDIYGPEASEQDPNTHLLCGYYNFNSTIPSALTRALPDCLVLTEEQIAQFKWLKITLDHLSDEYQMDGPGAQVVVDKLTEILLIEIVRLYISMVGQEGYLAALFDPQLSRALSCMHEQPEVDWTLDSLGEKAAMSRAVFARKFKALVGMPMFAYLTEVRINLAKERLRAPGARVATVAEAVGYRSEPAFVKVFKQQVGMTPRAWQKQTLSDQID